MVRKSHQKCVGALHRRLPYKIFPFLHSLITVSSLQCTQNAWLLELCFITNLTCNAHIVGTPGWHTPQKWFQCSKCIQSCAYSPKDMTKAWSDSSNTTQVDNLQHPWPTKQDKDHLFFTHHMEATTRTHNIRHNGCFLTTGSKIETTCNYPLPNFQ
jgi:hypothetical protein